MAWGAKTRETNRKTWVFENGRPSSGVREELMEEIRRFIREGPRRPRLIIDVEFKD